MNYSEYRELKIRLLEPGIAEIVMGEEGKLATATAVGHAEMARIWLDIGTREGPRIVDDVEMLRDALVHKGWRLGDNLHYERVEGAEHNEAAWSRRVRPFLEFLFPAS